MKARDLAALAALGLGGAWLYNRNKGAATPADMNAGVGKRDAGFAEDMNAGSGRRDAGFGEDMNAGVGRRDAGYSPTEMPAYQGRTADRRADIQSEYGKAAAAAPVATAPVAEARPAPVVAKAAAPAVKAAAPAAAPVVVKKPVAEAAAPAATTAEVKPAPAAEKQLPDAKRVTPYNSDIMYNNTVKFDPKRQDSQNKFEPTAENYRALDIMKRTGKSIPATMNETAEERKKRQGTVSAQSPNDQAQAHIARQKQSASEAKSIARDKVLTKARADLKEKHDREDRERRAISGKKRGGTVTRMASGGAVKSSASSRGDGIAQRGKTRGKMC